MRPAPERAKHKRRASKNKGQVGKANIHADGKNRSVDENNRPDANKDQFPSVMLAKHLRQNYFSILQSGGEQIEVALRHNQAREKKVNS